ncbi:MAG: GNAT family N-acetyltransferase [Chloroflexi bacterium]|nr:GNAT family N-acetyltransferase [Chloroflexota bacterium]
MSQVIKDTFRKLVTLEDGARLLLRPLIPEDVDPLVQLYAAMQTEDLLWVRQKFNDLDLIRSWADGLDYSRVLPLLAIIDKRIVGDATLQRRSGPYHHLADVRIFLAKDFRGRGLGTEMLCTLIEMARKAGLHWLYAEVFACQPKVIRAFESVGFKQKCVFENFFMMPDGQTEDVVIMLAQLLKPNGEF